jgi:predicted metalloendopeptidase
MRTTIFLLSALACSGGTAPTPTPAAAEAPEVPPPVVAETPEQVFEAFETSVAEAMNPDVGACDDFYAYACGGWEAATELPADRSRMVRSFTMIDDRNKELLRGILDDAVENPSDERAWQMVGAFYGACLDEAAIDARGAEPIQPWLEMTAAVDDLESFARAVGTLHAQGATVLFGGYTWADAKNPDVNIYNVGQSGLGLPDRDYYLDDSEEKATLRADYLAHVTRMLEAVGIDPDTAEHMAHDVLAFETQLAEISFPRAELRDPTKTYHKIDRDGLQELVPSLPLEAWLDGMGAPHIVDINVEKTEYFTGLEGILAKTDPEILRSYLTWHAVHHAAPELAAPLADEHFAFYGQRLRGQKEQMPRWKRCAHKLDTYLGDLLGQAYVERAFAGESKDKAVDMIRRIEQAFEAGLDDLDWMDDTTRERARVKAASIRNKIGYPDRWETYEGLQLGSDHFANLAGARAYDLRQDLDDVGQPVDEDQWFMSASTVNAYYNPTENEIAFPAGILQPPMFHQHWPMAANFGAMGVVMGHEITHGFDDSGRQFTAEGTMEDWWEAASAEGFESKAECVIDAYGSFEALPGVNVDGELTLGENIADIGGARFAFRAYQGWAAEQEQPEPDVAGLSPEQLYFVSFAQAWCAQQTDESLEEQVKTDPHSPAKFRINGTLRHTPAFHETFGCEPGSGMRPQSDDELCVVW